MPYFRDNIEQLSGYVPGFQPRGTDVIKLNTNESPYPPSPKVIDAIRNIPAESLRRYPQPLGDSFRVAASEILNVPSEWIICTNGGDDLLTLCLRAFCDTERTLAYPVPTYTLYPVLARIQDCSTIEIPFNDADWIDQLAATRAALTIICNPNAPTCHQISCEGLAKLAGQIEGVLLIDEAYVDYADDNCLDLVREFRNVIILRSMSKGYSLAGIRFGFGIAQPGLIGGLMKVKDSYNVDVVASAAATAAISDHEYYLTNIAKVKAERIRVIAQLRRMGFDVGESQTNFVLAACPDGRANEIHNDLADRHIYVRYFSTPDLADKLRITIGSAEQNDRLLNALKEIIVE
jgi:histidinol-phosphate aminotransferase